MQWLVIYLLLMNGIGWMMMAWDKRKAQRGAWRIPEARLFLCAALGGSVGSWLGMYMFHHKTKHHSFVIGMPLILAVQLGIALAVLTWRGMIV